MNPGESSGVETNGQTFRQWTVDFAERPLGDLPGAVRVYFSDSVFDKAINSGLQAGLQKLMADDVLGPRRRRLHAAP